VWKEKKVYALWYKLCLHHICTEEDYLSAAELCIVEINIFISQYLKDANLVDENTVTKPNEVEHEDLLLVHTARYLKSLKVNLKSCF
jgi:acetoin utilization deacetylase AcuC-like enzyme